MDVQNKSDRVEWGHVKYQAKYRPAMAYEMVVKWVASSGTIITDLVSINKSFLILSINFFL